MNKIKTVAKLSTHTSQEQDSSLCLSFDFVSLDAKSTFASSGDVTFAANDELTSAKQGIRQLLVKLPFNSLYDNKEVQNFSEISEWLMDSDDPSSKGASQFNKTVTMIRNKAATTSNIGCASTYLKHIMIAAKVEEVWFEQLSKENGLQGRTAYFLSDTANLIEAAPTLKIAS